MININICRGNACHRLQSHKVIEAFEKIVAQRNLNEVVNIVPTLCMGQCMNGVCISIDDEMVMGVTEGSAEYIFDTYVQSKLD